MLNYETSSIHKFVFGLVSEDLGDIWPNFVVNNVPEARQHLLRTVIVELGVVANLGDELRKTEVAQAQTIHNLENIK